MVKAKRIEVEALGTIDAVALEQSWDNIQQASHSTAYALATRLAQQQRIKSLEDARTAGHEWPDEAELREIRQWYATSQWEDASDPQAQLTHNFYMQRLAALRLTV